MGDFAITITIDEPPEPVFAFLADPAKLPLWLEAVDDVAFADTPPRRGARFQMARSLPGGRVANDVEFVEFDPGRRVALESRTGPTPFRYEYALDPTERGTRVRLVGRISTEGFPGPVARLDGIATQLFRTGMRRNLRTLEHLLATGGAADERT